MAGHSNHKIKKSRSFAWMVLILCLTLVSIMSYVAINQPEVLLSPGDSAQSFMSVTGYVLLGFILMFVLVTLGLWYAFWVLS
jgi:uncharacterized membrane protein